MFVSQRPLLSSEECADAIAQAEKWAAAKGGWTTSRHYTVPTTDVPLTELQDVLPWFNAALSRTLLPALASRYPQAAPEAPRRVTVMCPQAAPAVTRRHRRATVVSPSCHRRVTAMSPPCHRRVADVSPRLPVV